MCISWRSRVQEHKQHEISDQDAQPNSSFAKLPDYSLCRAVGSCGNNSVVNPSDIEDVTHGLANAKSENGRLTRKPE